MAGPGHAMRRHDYLVVGAGLYGAICAHGLRRKGKDVLVVESRRHVGGNCYTEKMDGINVHSYGPHIFHTSNESVWAWINALTGMRPFRTNFAANYKGHIYSLPFNMWTFSRLWGVSHPDEARKIIEAQGAHIGEPRNLEEQAIKLVGSDIYRILIEGYTRKQWMKDPALLPREIIRRLPVRMTYDNSYYTDKYVATPVDGYTAIFDRLLDGVEVRLGVDYLSDRAHFDSLAGSVIYTGPIDRFYGYRFGKLEYKTTRFDHRRLETDNYQGTAVMNYTDAEVPYTRVIEHKHFEGSVSEVSWVTWEYPNEYVAGETEPYYPVNDAQNNAMYEKYVALSAGDPHVHFGGRLGEYKYYDMDKIIERALGYVAQIG